MKYISFLSTLLGVIFFSHCTKHESCKYEAATDVYKLGLKYCIGEHEYIKITKIDDSRCPRETECFWEGKTDIYIDLFAHNTLHDAVLTIPNTNEPVTIKDVFGYNITVQDITPYPEKDKIINQPDYVVKMIVKAI